MADNLLDSGEASTSLVQEVLFPLPANRRTPFGILNWWESRRLVYNIVVGLTGLGTLATVWAISLIPPGLPRFTPPIELILAYGALANICYTFGPMVEIGLQQLWKDRVLPVGPTLFRQGLAFSVGLTMLPVIVASGTWVARLAMWLLGNGAGT